MIGCRVLTGMSFPRAATNAVEARSRDVLPLRSSPVETLKAWPNAVFSRASQRHRNRCVRTCLWSSFLGQGYDHVHQKKALRPRRRFVSVCVVDWRFAVCGVCHVGSETHLILDVKEIVLKCPLRTIK